MRAATGDRGTATLFVVGVALAFLAFTGLVVDGGLALASRRDAANAAEQAARAGVQKIDEDALRLDGTVTLDQAATAEALSRVPASIGAGTITARNAACGGDTCEVTLTVRRNTTILQIVGKGDFTFTVVGRARIVRGVDQEEG